MEIKTLEEKWKKTGDQKQGGDKNKRPENKHLTENTDQKNPGGDKNPEKDKIPKILKPDDQKSRDKNPGEKKYQNI
nr:hypothetical protein [Mycoplasmopsis bovis]